MKIDAGRIDAFLKDPTTPVVLIFGPDSGLIAERGLALVRSVEGALNDPVPLRRAAKPGRRHAALGSHRRLAHRRQARRSRAGRAGIPAQTRRIPAQIRRGRAHHPGSGRTHGQIQTPRRLRESLQRRHHRLLRHRPRPPARQPSPPACAPRTSPSTRTPPPGSAPTSPARKARSARPSNFWSSTPARNPASRWRTSPPPWPMAAIPRWAMRSTRPHRRRRRHRPRAHARL